MALIVKRGLDAEQEVPGLLGHLAPHRGDGADSEGSGKAMQRLIP
jgi:hypothetical protein